MTRLVQALIAIAIATLAASCSGSPGGPTMNNKMNANELAPAVSSVVSTDILAREPLANTATVKHILISWHDLADSFGGRIDPRADKRSKACLLYTSPSPRDS